MKSHKPFCRSSYFAIFTSIFIMLYISTSQAQISSDPCLTEAACVTAVEKAKTLSNRAEYTAAIESYKDIYQKWPAPWLIFNIGRVYHKMSQYSLAAVYYQRYVEDAQVTDLAQQEQARVLLAEVKLKLDPPPSVLPLQVVAAQPVQPTQPPLPRKQPIYKKWWLWTLAGLAVSGIVTGAVVGTQVQQGLGAEVPRYMPF